MNTTTNVTIIPRRNSHTMIQRLQLAEQMRQLYSASAMSDDAFAKASTETLGFAITEGQVRYMRDNLGIQANLPPRGRPVNTEVAAATAAEILDLRNLLDDANQTIAVLTSRIERLERFEFVNYPRHQATG